EDGWRPVAEKNAPVARSGHAAVWTGERMIVWGGEGDNDALFADGGLYDPIKDTWETLPLANAPSERSFHSAVWTGKKMIVWGGLDSFGTLRTGAI
ncbi:Kelch repeat-containing protein, partial [Glaesserella parasuis]|uniref:Kelch repeat-containing protein n=1 Tax=Glaesserella parasuis TaxID=738 RepID=UPI003F38D349